MSEIEIRGTPEEIVTQIRKLFALEQQKNLYAWICVFRDACEDCKKYHGQIAYISVWEKREVPGRGKSKCGSECTCKLIHYELYPKYYAPLPELPLKNEVIKSIKSGEGYKIVDCNFERRIDGERYSIKSFDPEEERELLVWIAQYRDSCAECIFRHGKIKTYAEWKSLGLPGSSFCPVCHCSLISAADYKKYYVPIEKLPLKDNSIIEEEKETIEEESRQEQRLRENPIFAMQVYDSIHGTDNYGLYLKNLQEKVLSILKEHNGVLREDFYKYCTSIAQDDVKLVLRMAEREGKIRRVQKGSDYQLFLAKES
jgi:hypothetical protein